jgi:hypothetical protein
MKTEKMTYEKPTVQKVEFDFKTRIADSSCGYGPVTPEGNCPFEP